MFLTEPSWESKFHLAETMAREDETVGLGKGKTPQGLAIRLSLATSERLVGRSDTGIPKRESKQQPEKENKVSPQLRWLVAPGTP